MHNLWNISFVNIVYFNVNISIFVLVDRKSSDKKGSFSPTLYLSVKNICYLPIQQDQ